MKRTTITLTDDLAEALDREARRSRVSASQVTRDALAAHLGVGGEGLRPIPFAALGASGKRHTARDTESILEREWGDARRR
jgi:Ribbon-helix-helix protein, copG family